MSRHYRSSAQLGNPRRRLCCDGRIGAWMRRQSESSRSVGVLRQCLLGTARGPCASALEYEGLRWSGRIRSDSRRMCLEILGWSTAGYAGQKSAPTYSVEYNTPLTQKLGVHVVDKDLLYPSFREAVLAVHRNELTAYALQLREGHWRCR